MRSHTDLDVWMFVRSTCRISVRAFYWMQMLTINAMDSFYRKLFLPPFIPSIVIHFIIFLLSHSIFQSVCLMQNDRIQFRLSGFRWKLIKDLYMQTSFICMCVRVFSNSMLLHLLHIDIYPIRVENTLIWPSRQRILPLTPMAPLHHAAHTASFPGNSNQMKINSKALCYLQHTSILILGPKKEQVTK